MLSGGASASVIANSDVVNVYMLEGSFINLVINKLRPEMGGKVIQQKNVQFKLIFNFFLQKFYKFLAVQIAEKIKQRQKVKLKS